MRTLVFNPEAERLQAEGVALAVVGEYETAHERFADALGIIGEVDLGVESFNPMADAEVGADALARTVQVATVRRDIGVSCMRQAVALHEKAPDSSSALLAQGGEEFRRSLEMTGGFVDWFSEPNTTRESVYQADLYAEHGITLTAKRRTLTAREIVIEDQRPSEDVLHRDYARARMFVGAGNNGYYRVNTELVCARDHRATGDAAMAKTYFESAVRAAVWTAMNDRPNLSPVNRTLVRRGLDLRSRKTALASLTPARL